MTRKRMIQEIIEKRFPFYTSVFQAVTHSFHTGLNTETEPDKQMMDALWSQFPNEIQSYHGKRSTSQITLPLNDEDGVLTEGGRIRLLSYIDEAQSQYEKFCSLPTHDIEDMYNIELHDLILERAAASDKRAKAADETAPFSMRTARAAFHHWLKQPIWTAEEATALSFGRDPHKVNIALLQNYKHLHGSRFKDNFYRRLDFINRSIAATQLAAPITPHAFVRWAKAHDVSLDNELDTLLQKREDSGDETELRWAQLEAENREMKLYIDRIHDIDFSDAKTRLSIYRILLGMAVSSPYKYRPGKRNSASRIISGKCEEIGLKISEETVKQWLDEAFDILRADVIIDNG